MASRMDRPRSLVYTAEGLFEIPPVYIATALPVDALTTLGHLRDVSFAHKFGTRSTMHKEFRIDRNMSILHGPKALAELALNGGVLPLVNDVIPSDEDYECPQMKTWKDLREQNWEKWRQPAPRRQVLWCIEMRVDADSFGFEQRFGKGFLLVVPQTRELEEALKNWRTSSLFEDRYFEDMYPLHRSLMMGVLKHTTSLFDPAEWPMALPAEDLSYTEAVFAMSFRPAPMHRNLKLQPPPYREARQYIDYSIMGEARRAADPVLSTMASSSDELVDLSRPLVAQRGQAPELPSDIMETIFLMAARRGVAGNTLWDWKSHLALRLVNVQARNVVRDVSLGIVTALRDGITPMASDLKSKTSWPDVLELREIALLANLHPIDVIVEGNKIDQFTIMRIRRCKNGYPGDEHP